MPTDDYTPSTDITVEVAMGLHAEWNSGTDKDAWYDMGAEARLKWCAKAVDVVAVHDAALREQIAGEILALVDPKYDSRTWGSGITDSPGAAFTRALQHAAHIARGKE